MPKSVVTDDNEAITQPDSTESDQREATGSAEPGTEARVLLRELPADLKGQKRGGTELRSVYAGDVQKR